MQDDQKGEEKPATRRREPIFMLPAVISALGGLMLVIQGLSAFLLNESQRMELIVWLGFVPVRLVAPDQFPGGLWPLLWTPFTYGFVHGGWEHVIGNVAWLVIFGTPVARRYGVVRTLVIFFISSAIGALAFGITSFNVPAYLVGASGGIAGLTGAAMRFIFQPVIVGRDPETGAPVALGRKMATIPEMLRSPPARNFTIIWVVLNCLVPLAPMFIGQDVEIAWQAHLGGFFTGLLLVPFFEHGAGRQRAERA
ncbi:MAG TPA: rhomboid family intramembrane serine protease [Devosiaceae bacterium]|nr:rhomboid family intramembrane serine protease [Devosiaceae bacterium]